MTITAARSPKPIVQTARGPVMLDSDAELAFWEWSRRLRLPEPEPQFKLTIRGKERRFDFGYRAARLLVEINGGVGDARQAHSSYAGVTDDYLKWDEAVVLGWRVMLFTVAQANSGDAALLVQRALGLGEEQAE